MSTGPRIEWTLLNNACYMVFSMRISTLLKEGFRNLYHAKLRSILALLGILVGSASVVAMVMGGELATQEALKQFKTLGTDLFAVSINSSNEERIETASKGNPVSVESLFNIHQVNRDILVTAPYSQQYFPLSFEGHALDGMTLGVTGSFFEITRPSLLAGRFISIADQYNAFCVVGHELYNAMQESTSVNPIGMPIRIGKNVFIIAGVLNPWPVNNFIYASLDHSVMIPLKTSLTLNKYSTISNIVFRLTPNADLKQIETHLQDYLSQLMPGKQLSFRSAKELVAKMRKQNDIMTIFLGLIGSISLIVGGIGVMNIMLVSVIERKREIGLRLAVGATPSDITLLFLAEAIALSLVGGTLGVIIGIAIAYGITVYSHWTFTFYLWPPIIGFLVSMLVGVFFGFYPAFKASRLDPILALRAD